jgi:Domain of unknown function (DUF4157)
MRAFTQGQNQPKEQASNGAAKQPIKTSAVSEALQSTGQPLDASTQEFMESRFDHDFSRVRVHTDAKAAQSAHEVGALAYTVGSNIAFAAGQYAPQTRGGKRLLAHELTHVTQQHVQGKRFQAFSKGGAKGDVYEREAEQKADEVVGDDSEVQKMLAENLEKIKCGDYDADAKAKYAAARKLLAADLAMQFPLSPEDKQLLVDIIAPREKDATSPPKITACNIRRTEYDESDVQHTAWQIVQGEKSVADAYIFYGRMKGDESENRKELKRFFAGGFQPRVTIEEMDKSGETPDEKGLKKHKEMYLNAAHSFFSAVATYLHEMSHYIDIWYSSNAAKMKDIFSKKDRHQPEAERKRGIAKGKTNMPDKPEQVSAFQESLTAIIEQILIDMKKPDAVTDEHHLTPKYRRKYYTDKQKTGFVEADFVKEKRIELAKRAADLYKPWGAKADENTGEITATGIELGYAFEKTAYGFYDPNNTQGKGEWAVGFIEKFKEKFCKYFR